MSAELVAVRKAALNLSAAERADLAGTLLASLREAPKDLHPTWEAEIARRVADLDAGRTKTIPGETVLEELRTIIAEHPDPGAAFDAILRQGQNDRPPPKMPG